MSKSKNKSIIFKLASTASGYFKVYKKNPKNHTTPLSLNKFDPIVRKHVKFVEQKNKQINYLAVNLYFLGE